MPANKDGLIYVVTGSSGSGKTAWLIKQIKKAGRLIIWDAKPEYHKKLPGVKLVRTRKELIAICKTKKNYKIAYHPGTVNNKEFEFWSDCAYLAARIKPCKVVAEETADVTQPGKASDKWGQLVRKIRETGSDIYAVTQRPSESDKTAVGNASIFHVARMSRNNDRRYMSQELDINAADIAALENLQYIEKDMRTNKVTTGTVTF